MEDLHNTGQELMEMCTDEDATDVKEDVEHVNAKYEDVKKAIRQKLNDIDDALRNATTDVSPRYYTYPYNASLSRYPFSFLLL